MSVAATSSRASTTRLITEPGTRPSYHARAECDAATALRRGLAEYIASRSAPADGGRNTAIARVYWDMPEAEEKLQMPAAHVDFSGDGVFDPAGFAPNELAAAPIDAVARTSLLCVSEIVVRLRLVFWCEDPRQRQAVMRWAEGVLFPCRWSSGFRLALGHYYGAVAEYGVQSVMPETDEAEARERMFLVVYELQASAPVLVPIELSAAAQPSARVIVTTEALDSISVEVESAGG